MLRIGYVSLKVSKHEEPVSPGSSGVEIGLEGSSLN